MKPAAPDVGRRRFVLGCAALGIGAGAGCASESPRPQAIEGLLSPRFSFSGARLLTQVDLAGNASPEAYGAYVSFVFPVAVAVAYNDIYVADAGLGRLFRYDRGLDAMAVLPGIGVTLETKLQTGPDASIYVLDPANSVIRRFSRAGRLITSFRPRLATSRYSEFAVSPLTGRIFAVDSLHRSIDELDPLGLVAIEMMRLDETGPIATDGRSLLVAGSACQCAGEWINGRRGRSFGAKQLRQPRALVLDQGHLLAIDGMERAVALLHEEGSEVAPSAPLGLLAPQGLAAAQGLIYVADALTHKIAAFSLRHPRRP